MPYIPDISGTSALNNMSEFTQTIEGTADAATADIIQFPGNAAQSVEVDGTAFYGGVASVTGTGAAAAAGLAGVTIPTSAAIVAATGAMALGAKLGEAWYDNNPDLWNEIGEKIYNLNPELSQQMGLSVWSWIQDGKVYVDKQVLDVIAETFVSEGILTGVDTLVVDDVEVGDMLTISSMTMAELCNFVINKYVKERAMAGFHVVVSPSIQQDITDFIEWIYNNYSGVTIFGARPFIATNLGESSVPTRAIGGIEIAWSTDLGPFFISSHTAGSNEYNGDKQGGYSARYTSSPKYLFYNVNTGQFSEHRGRGENLISTSINSYIPQDLAYNREGGNESWSNIWNFGGIEKVYPAEGIEAQDGASIMQVGDTIATKYPDWMNNAITRPTKWHVDPDTGDIKIDEEIITIPLEFPFQKPNPAPNPNPEIDPNPDPEKDPWKKAQEATQDQPDEEQAQQRKQEGELPGDDAWPDDEPASETYKDLYEDFVEFIEKVIHVPDPQIEAPTGGTGTAPAIVVPVGDAQALFTVYNPTQGQINSFGAWLWSSNFIDNLIKVIENPIDCIISLKKIFITPDTSGAANIYCGHLNSGVSANLVSAQYKEIDLGSIEIPLHFYDATDFEPYTSISCYLPFIGMVELSAHDCVEATMSIKYVVDCYNGDFTANIELSKDDFEGVTYVYTGSCAVEYPITGSNHAALALGAAVTAVTSVMTGGLSLAALAGLGTQLGGKQSINGQMSGNAGACGNKTPYVIIKRTIPKPASNFSKYRGFGASKLVNIGNLSGYTRVKAIITDGIEGANDSEILEIESILKDGFIAG